MEQFIIFFVLFDVVGDVSDKSTIGLVPLLVWETHMGIVSDDLVQGVALAVAL